MKKILAAMTAALMMVSLVSSVAVAKTPGSSGSLIPGQWKVYNIKAATSSWDINKAQQVGTTLQFPIQQFLTTTTGSFAVYLLDNYNVNITGKVLSADLAWTKGTYRTRGDASGGAYVRLEFQDVTAGPYTASDYWWSTVSLDLNALTSGTLTASLADCTLWTNMDGTSACADTAGFANATKNVKLLGLSFGNTSSSYASGIALVGGPGTFTVSAFTVQ